MTLDIAVLTRLTRRVLPEAYLRCTPLVHRATPIGMGYGNTRFASPTDSFKLIYIAEDLATAVAETVIRDRFEGATTRQVMPSDIVTWGVCEVGAVQYLRVLDLRGDGCFKLGISTDIVGAKAHNEARAFSQHLYDTTDLDGIMYHSRLRHKNCLAVYDRACPAKLRASDVVDLVALSDLVPALSKLRIELIA